MTKLLEEAFKKASQLPVIEQNSFARWILEELEAEKKWNNIISDSESLLDELTDEALEERKRGATESLDIAKL